MFKFLTRFLGSNEAEIKKLLPIVEKINALEASQKKLKEKDFAKKTVEFKSRLEKGETLNDLLPEAFALVREASFRMNNERHHDVQLMGGIVLHEGKIAEHKTGEGKTLIASLPLYLNALTGKGVHLVTVNDYLARVGVGWMGPIFHLLGLSSSVLIRDNQFTYDPEFTDEEAADWRLRHLRPITKKEAYQSDIVYGINSEFGFDYLRDNMADSIDNLVQRQFHYAIIDEADSVLIDEARTPHILSSAAAEATDKYFEYAKIVEKLSPALDYLVDEKLHTAHLTDHGISKIESLLGAKDIYEKDFATVHHIEAALKAKTLYKKEKDYIVKDGKVIIVDEFTGRLLPNNRWGEGVHQAVEAKEGVAIQQESKTLATISLQNYFRKYEKLAGMTGTALTESEEFNKIYGLEVVAIPTNKPMARIDHVDHVYKNQRSKYAAVVKDIEEAHKAGRPVLVGTTSIEKNEIISQFLRHKGIPHEVLNAKQHEKEAAIISKAGKKGAVTVATNMAGRGVDIILGGNTPTHEDGRPKLGTPEWKKWQKDHDEVISLGGLHVIGTERHESRRIDNQLRGRAGRQGDPGSTRFFVALDDEIMRLFGGDQVSKLMTFFNLPEDQPLEHGIVSKSIEQAQTKVEQFNFDRRKHLLEYDDVMNSQREIIYDLRRKVLAINFEDSKNPVWLKEQILNKINNEITLLTTSGLSSVNEVIDQFSLIIPFDDGSKSALSSEFAKRTTPQEQSEFLQKIAQDIYEDREKQMGEKIVRYIEQQEMIRVIDTFWMEHLETINDLREGIGLRSYAQRNPLVEYKSEAFNLFEKLVASIDYEVVRRVYKVSAIPADQARSIEKMLTNAGKIENIEGGVREEAEEVKEIKEENKKIGRNDPCWCGSGKKYKKCHYPN